MGALSPGRWSGCPNVPQQHANWASDPAAPSLAPLAALTALVASWVGMYGQRLKFWRAMLLHSVLTSSSRRAPTLLGCQNTDHMSELYGSVVNLGLESWHFCHRSLPTLESSSAIETLCTNSYLLLMLSGPHWLWMHFCTSILSVCSTGHRPSIHPFSETTCPKQGCGGSRDSQRLQMQDGKKPRTGVLTHHNTRHHMFLYFSNQYISLPFISLYLLRLIVQLCTDATIYHIIAFLLFFLCSMLSVNACINTGRTNFLYLAIKVNSEWIGILNEFEFWMNLYSEWTSNTQSSTRGPALKTATSQTACHARVEQGLDSEGTAARGPPPWLPMPGNNNPCIQLMQHHRKWMSSKVA